MSAPSDWTVEEDYTGPGFKVLLEEDTGINRVGIRLESAPAVEGAVLLETFSTEWKERSL